MFRLAGIAFLVATGLNLAVAQVPVESPAQAPVQTPAATAPVRPPRPTPPTRDPHTPGYVTAKELPDGANPSPKEDGNFILGPTHNPAPEMTVQEGVPQGTIFNFTM